jgi:hypothetical protein
VKRLARKGGIARERDSAWNGRDWVRLYRSLLALSRGERVTSANTCNARRSSA